MPVIPASLLHFNRSVKETFGMERPWPWINFHTGIQEAGLCLGRRWSSTHSMKIAKKGRMGNAFCMSRKDSKQVTRIAVVSFRVDTSIMQLEKLRLHVEKQPL